MAPFHDDFRNGAMLLLGYARVGTDSQDLAPQRRALRNPASAGDEADEPALT